MELFTYGTLMFPEVWLRVAGRPCVCEPATLDGYTAFRAVREVYPVMLAARVEDRVAGIVYRDVDAAALARLDEFESTLYTRQGVAATLADGRTVACEAYVLPAYRRQYASAELWDADRFRSEELVAYLERLAGWGF